MAQLYFHCSSARVVDIDQCGTDLDDLIEARDHAAQVVRSLVTTSCLEDWRKTGSCTSATSWARRYS
jgi:hypothetical protein